MGTKYLGSTNIKFTELGGNSETEILDLAVIVFLYVLINVIVIIL